MIAVGAANARRAHAAGAQQEFPGDPLVEGDERLADDDGAHGSH